MSDKPPMCCDVNVVIGLRCRNLFIQSRVDFFANDPVVPALDRKMT